MNDLELLGTITTDFTEDYEYNGERFSKVFIAVERDSGAVDLLPVIVPDKALNTRRDCTGKSCYVRGEFRSRNQKGENGKTKLILYVFAFEFVVIDGSENENGITITGHLCRKPSFRITPLGRKISDVLMAVTRQNGKTDYLPCVLWGRNAIYALTLDTGDYVKICGRVQSRQYEKGNDIMTAYEISGRAVEAI